MMPLANNQRAVPVCLNHFDIFSADLAGRGIFRGIGKIFRSRRVGVTADRGLRSRAHMLCCAKSEGIQLAIPEWQSCCMSRPTPPSYKTKNWPAYNEALK